MRPGSALALEGQLVLCTGSRVNLLSQTFELRRIVLHLAQYFLQEVRQQLHGTLELECVGPIQ